MGTFLFIVGVVIILAGIGAIIFAKYDDFAATELRIGGGLGIGGGLILALLMCFTIVPTQQVGIPVTFGKPGDPLSNGFHVKAPWTVVEMMDGTIQIDDNLNERRTEIRLGNQSVAYVQNAVRWRIDPMAASQLFRDHKQFSNIGPALEEQELAAALNEAFKDYNPLNQATEDAMSLDEVAKNVQERLQSKLKGRLVIESVLIPKVDFDQQTQARIDALQQEIGNTRIAEQRKKTSAAEAEANKILSESVSKDPNVLVSKCMDQMTEMVNRGQQIPVGFSCWPGTNTTGVIVGQK